MPCSMALSSRISRSRSAITRSRVSTICRSDSVRCCSSSLMVLVLLVRLKTLAPPVRRDTSRSPDLRTSGQRNGMAWHVSGCRRPRAGILRPGLPTMRYCRGQSWVVNGYLRPLLFAFLGFATDDSQPGTIKAILRPVSLNQSAPKTWSVSFG